MLKLRFLKEVYSFFASNEKNKFHILIFFILISTVFELLGIGLLVPILEIFVNENAIQTNKFANYFYILFGFTSQNTFIFTFCIFLILFFFMKSVFLAFIKYYEINFSNYLNYTWSTKLFKIYTAQPFNFFSKNNSSILIRNLKDEISRAVNGVILQVSILISEILLVLGILSFLLYLQPLMTLFAVIYFLSINFLFFFTTKKFLYLWGQNRQLYDGLRFKNLIQTFNGIKEIKLNSSENEFIDMYYNHSKLSVTFDGKSNFINALPRLMFEIFSIIVFVIFVYIILLSEKNLLNFVPIIGIFAFSAFKLLPSSNKILNCFQLIRYHLPSFYVIKKELNLKIDKGIINTNNLISFKKTLSLNGVEKNYDNKLILKDISFEIHKNEFIGIIGQSGSGKTTLINLILALIKPDKGDIKSDQQSIYKSEKNWQKKISLIPQEIFLFDDTIKRNIAFTFNDDQIDEERVLKSIDEANLSQFISNLDEGINTTVGERGLKISGGQKQRIGIARALYKNPEILILDEATSNLDQNTENELIKTIISFKEKKTVIIIAHRMNIISYCDKIYEIKNNMIRLIESKK